MTKTQSSLKSHIIPSQADAEETISMLMNCSSKLIKIANSSPVKLVEQSPKCSCLISQRVKDLVQQLDETINVYSSAYYELLAENPELGDLLED